MRLRKTLVAASSVAALCLAVATAHASQSAFSNVAVGLGIGTDGVGVVATTSVIPGRLNVNLGVSDFSHSFSFNADDSRYHADLRLGAVPLTLSFYPFGGNFSVDAGAFINLNRASITGIPQADGTYTINGHVYTGSEVGSVTGATHFNQVAPYVGIGWGNPLAGGPWTLRVNAGAIYEGSANVSLSATGAANNPQLASDVNAARASLNDHLSFMNWWPVVTIGISRRF